MTSSFGSQTKHGEAYVVAENSDEAYTILRKHLDKKDLGFRHERELDTVQLIAEEVDYPDCGTMLLQKEQQK
jgi:hypothetical protein